MEEKEINNNENNITEPAAKLSELGHVMVGADVRETSNSEEIYACNQGTPEEKDALNKTAKKVYKELEEKTAEKVGKPENSEKKSFNKELQQQQSEKQPQQNSIDKAKENEENIR